MDDRLARCFAGVVVMGRGSGELWKIASPEKFDAQARVVQHYLYCNGVPVIICPRRWGLVTHDDWHFVGSPANRRAMAPHVHACADLLQQGHFARAAWIL